MTVWWYAEKEKKIGPVAVEELKQLLQHGKINPGTMLWREGMDAWQPLAELEELQTIKATVPPPLPPKLSPDPLTSAFATRWPRFFARYFDIWWETMLVGFALGVLSGFVAPVLAFVDWLNNRSFSILLFGMFCIPVGLILDAAVYRLMGNTPGKALLCLKVGTPDGRQLGFGQYLLRNFLMWAGGLAFSVPLVSMFTQIRQACRLGKGKQASYDEPARYRVSAKPVGWVRKVGFGFVFFCMLLASFTMLNIEKRAMREKILSGHVSDYFWENPITRLNAKIDGRWKFSTQQNADGQQIYVFTERTYRAILVFGVEQASGFTLNDYIDAFKIGTAETMRLSDGGHFFKRDGRLIWQGSGSMVNNSSSRLNIQVIQFGSSFWRVVTVQEMPYDYSERLIAQLTAALWSTVK